MDSVSSDSIAEPASAVCGSVRKELVWKKRATVVTGATHRRRTWQSRCGWYRVVHSRCLFGPRKGRQAIADVFYATKLVVVSGSTCWEVISQHRKRGPAVRSCEQDARKNRDTTQVCDRCGERPPTHFEVQTLFESNAQLCGPCWHQLRRHRRCHRVSAGGSRSGTRRRIASSPGQLSFSFSHEVRD